jgi:hypothetical protein
MSFNPDKITEFWNWFTSISTELLNHNTNQRLINQLDDHVKELGPVDWEIGPWADDLQFLAISPNLKIDILPFTQQIIALAPHCPGWHFLPSKPPKEWSGSWYMKNELGMRIKVNTDAWQYILYQFDDNTFAIDIKTTEIDGNQETQNLAVDIALTGCLGEEYFRLMISDVQIIDEFEEAVKSKATLLKNIKNHIESLN